MKPFDPNSPHSSADLEDSDFERAAMHALGGLPAAEAIAYDAHVAICEPCRVQVETYLETTNALGFVSEEAETPESLERRLLDRVRDLKRPQPKPASFRTSAGLNPSGKTPASSFFMLASEGRWEPTSVVGVSSRALFVDVENDRATMLFKIEPGASYPAHRHHGQEECFVLQGDLRIGAVTMVEGDYQFAAAGSEHPEQSTTGGCVLLISTSLSDQIL